MLFKKQYSWAHILRWTHLPIFTCSSSTASDHLLSDAASNGICGEIVVLTAHDFAPLTSCSFTWDNVISSTWTMFGLIVGNCDFSTAWIVPRKTWTSSIALASYPRIFAVCTTFRGFYNEFWNQRGWYVSIWPQKKTHKSLPIMRLAISGGVSWLPLPSALSENSSLAYVEWKVTSEPRRFVIVASDILDIASKNSSESSDSTFHG